MTNIVVTAPPAPAPDPDGRAPAPAPAAPAPYTVTATVANPITFNVNDGGRTNIASETDAAINHGNFPTAGSDLTPDLSSDGGRPPRTTFWARDLTVIHEQFHANECLRFAATGVTTAQAWLNTQTASSVADVQSLLTQVPGKALGKEQALLFPAPNSCIRLRCGCLHCPRQRHQDQGERRTVSRRACTCTCTRTGAIAVASLPAIRPL